MDECMVADQWCYLFTPGSDADACRRRCRLQDRRRVGPDDEERLRKREHDRGLPPNSLRFATQAELNTELAHLDAKFFPGAVGCQHHQPCFTCQRLSGAQGDS